MCVRHIPFLASLQSRRDLQAWVSVTTFYCLQACEQGLLFGRGLNSKSNKLGFFIWQRFFNCNGFLQFPWPQSGGRGRGGRGGVRGAEMTAARGGGGGEQENEDEEGGVMMHLQRQWMWVNAMTSKMTEASCTCVCARGRTGSERACVCISHTDGSLKTPLHLLQCPADVDQQVSSHVFHEKASSSETQDTSFSDLAWRLSVKLIERVPSLWSFILLWLGGSPGWIYWTPTPPTAFDLPVQAQACCNTVCYIWHSSSFSIWAGLISNKSW